MNVRQIQTDPHFHSVGQAAASVVADADPYGYWRRALEIGRGRQLTREQSRPLGITMEPKCGYYRKRNKEGSDIPVAIWVEDGAFVAMAGERMVAPDDIWTWCCAWPIAHEVYEAVVNGGAWPDDVPVADPVIGHNMPDDPHEAAKYEFEGDREIAEKFLKTKITTQEQADQAAVWSKRFGDLFNKVDRLFRAKKDPIVQAGKEVDEEFRWRQDVKDLATALKRAQDAFLIEQERLERERQRRAREEEIRLQREAEEKARKAAAEASRASEAERARLQREADEAAAAAAAKAREAQAQTVSAGRTGAKVSLRTYYVAKITDYDKLVIALKDTPEVREAIEKVAGSIARGKGPVPAGMERVEEKRAA